MLRDQFTNNKASKNSNIRRSPRMLGRRERNKLDKLARLKEAARTLFARKGFEATTTREIAERADIGAGTLFLYFKTKEEILVLLFREEMGRTIDAAFTTLPDRQPLLDQLLHVFNAVIAYHERDVGLARIFVKELPFVEGRLRQEINAFLADWHERLAGLIEQAQRRGELRVEVPPLPLARNCFALYLSRLRQWLSGDLAREKLADRLRLTLALQLCGLLQGKAAQQCAKALATEKRGTNGMQESAPTPLRHSSSQ